jgi:hypothetical protein
MAEIGLSGDSQSLLQGLTEAIKANTDAMGTKAEGDSDNQQRHSDSTSGLVNLLNKLSIPLPGGARLFGIGDFITSVATAKGLMNKISTGLAQMVIAIFGASEAFLAFGRSLGGVTGGEAMRTFFGNLSESFQAMGRGRLFQSPIRTARLQGSFAGEFGGLLTPESASLLSDAVTDLGLSESQFTSLSRTLQGTTLTAYEAVDQFRQVGIGGAVASEEMTKNAAAVARAGGQFNAFIVSGIKNAKALGYEFSEIESKLTGFTLDFEGTVSSFSELRAVIPGMATDFGQLLSTAMTGTQEEYVDQIRSGLFGAGISSASQLNRQTASLLESATGFSADQIDRILQGQEVEGDFQKELDTTRNSLLRSQIVMMAGGFGMITGAIIASNPLKSGIFGAASKVLVPMLSGILMGGIGTGVGALATSGMNDFVYRPGQPPVPFNSKDTLVGVKDPSMLGGNGNLEAKMDRIANLLSGQQSVNVNLENGTAWVARHVGNATQGELRTA